MNLKIKGRVARGERVGTTLGFPTANIPLDPVINITEGVYAAVILYEGFKYHGMANVGYHPTMGRSPQLQLEVHLFDFNGLIYDKEIEVSLIERIREERHFDSPEELKTALEADKRAVERIL